MLAWAMAQAGGRVFVLQYAGHCVVSPAISRRCMAVSSGRFSYPTSYSRRSFSSSVGVT
jgi:hypothetical protein